ncbi:T9SS type A sorting domain-containing protein [Crocinitomix catalasitica]|nr:T9SS type A sorting domain-containing protein [Crocinitomix catalasitica]
MKRTLLITAFAVFSSNSFAQDILFTEDFETGGASFNLNTSDLGGITGTGGANQWIINMVYGGGVGTDTDCSFADITVQDVPPQPPPITSTDGNYLHIYSDIGQTFCATTNCNVMVADGIGGCSGAETHFVSMASDISTLGYTTVTLDFWWLCEGSSFAYGELYYSTDAGGSWTQYTAVPDYEGQNIWANEVLTDPAWEGQATIRWAFRFVNNLDFGSYSNYIAWGIDDVEISATAGAGCSDSFSSFPASDCSSYTVPSGDETYTTTGTYTVMDTIPNSAGCDSIMTITLTIGGITATIVDNGDGTATAGPTGGGITYQWIDCDNGNMPIVGATSNTYSAAVFFSGNVACIVTDGTCSDTTACMPIIFDEVEENGFSETIVLFPNPTENNVSIDLGDEYEQIEVTITDLSGRIIRSEIYHNISSIEQLEAPIESGTYFVILSAEGGEKAVIRLVKK